MTTQHCIFTDSAREPDLSFCGNHYFDDELNHFTLRFVLRCIDGLTDGSGWPELVCEDCMNSMEFQMILLARQL